MILSDKCNISEIGINTANVSLHVDKIDIISQCLEKFFKFLNSDQNRVLSNTFFIEMKVLRIEHISIAHVDQEEDHKLKENYTQTTETNQNPTSLAEGTKKEKPFSTKNWIFSPPRGFSHYKLMFPNKGLMVAAIFGVWRIRSLIAQDRGDINSEDCKIWEVFCGLYSFDKNKEKRAGFAIDEEMSKVAKAKDIDISSRDCHRNFLVQKILPKYADYYKCQFVVYSDRDPKCGIYYESHRPIRDNLPIVLLYQEANTNTDIDRTENQQRLNRDNIYLIYDQLMLQTHLTFQCYDCRNFYKGNNRLHVCNAKVQYIHFKLLLMFLSYHSSSVSSAPSENTLSSTA